MSTAAFCPECDSEISFSTQPDLGECVICAKCQSALTVIQLNPIVMDWAFLEPFKPPMHQLRPTPPKR